MTPRRGFSSGDDRLRMLLLFVVLQAFLLTVNPGLLPLWGDEATTLSWVGLPMGEMLRAARADIHPPLYFLLARAWLKLLGTAWMRPSDPLIALRLLSALYAVLTTILIDRLWLRKVSVDLHQWVLLLWSFSPCLMLFGRMARSYSLQALLTVVAVWSLIRFTEEAWSWKRTAALAGAITALLYTHYLPGIAMWGGANVWLLMRLRAHQKSIWGTYLRTSWQTWLLPNALVATAYLPWMVTLAAVLHRWGHKDLYRLTGNALPEAALKLAYGFYSLAFGEAIPIWLLALSLLLVLPYLGMLLRGALTQPQWLAPAAAVALLGYLGAAHWVSYPFMGARLLFLLPPMLLAVGAGIEKSGRIGTVFGVALFAASAGGVWSYFQVDDILNVAYVAPNRRIADTIAASALPTDSLVWVDGLNVDDNVLSYYLPLNYPVRVLRSATDAAAAWDELQRKPGIRQVWFIRNAHDISAGHAFERLEQRMMGAWYSHTLHPYLPVSATNRLALRLLTHTANPPRYVYEVWEFHR